MGDQKENTLAARLERLRRMRRGVLSVADEFGDQVKFFFASLWGGVLRMSTRMGLQPRLPSFLSTWRRMLSWRPIRPIVYGVRWLDVHHRRYTRRWRRSLRNYLLVLLDPGVPVGRRAVLGARGAGIAAAAGTVALVVYTIALIPFTPPLSTIRQLGNQHPAVVLDVRGDVITRYRRVNREWVELHEVSPYFLNALLTTEDRRFYDHFGIDVPRVIGAGLRTLTGDLQGGSTISQQLARNLFPDRIGRSISLDRKLKEVVTAFKIEAIYTKEEILESYINTVPFLFNTVGVEMAARTYFGKPAADLDVVESATLVGMLKGTYYYNPVRNPGRALNRRNLILAEMTRHGSVSIDDYGDLISEPLDLRFELQPIRESRAPHFTEFVRRWLVSWADEHGFNIYTDSLVVHTTLDLRMQELAADAIERQGEALQAVADVEWSQRSFGLRSTNPFSYINRRRDNAFAYFWTSRDSLVKDYIKSTTEFRAMRDDDIDVEAALDSLRSDPEFTDSLRKEKTRLEAGFLAIAPRIGHVRAWVGSRDFESDEFDHVAQARRQAGSTFKPFLYAAAIESGFSPDDRFTDQPVAIRLDGRRVWRPENAGEYSFRSMTLRDALAHSVNTISAQLVERVGPERVADMARRAGVESDLDVVPSIALGTSAVSLKEMVTAFSTLAAGGIHHEPVTVLRIEDRDGNVLYEARDVGREVISESVTSTVVDMMRGVINDGTGRRIRFAYDIGTDVAGKTGTTQDGADGWFLLMHPDLVAGAWVGFNDQRITFRSSYWGQGAHTALPIVGEFFRDALRDRSLGLENEPAPPPEIRYVRVQRRGVEGWLRDVFDGASYERVVVERERPRSNLGLRTENLSE